MMDETPRSEQPVDSDTAEESEAVDDLPPEAVEEAQRWEDVPGQEPEESTGIDV
jgi:hypothetical protein